MKPVRLISPPGTYFVTFSTWHRRKLFVVETYVRLFLRTLYRHRREGRYTLHAFVVMPEHVHLVLTPAIDVTLERTIQLINGAYSHELGTIIGRDQEIWQRGFTDHRIRDEVDFMHHQITFVAIPWSGILWPILLSTVIAPRFPDSNWILGPQRLKPQIK